MLGFTLVFILRFAWQRLRSSNKLGPIDNLRAELQEIEGALGRAPATRRAVWRRRRRRSRSSS